MHWFIESLKKYATFSGRARRKEYWMYQLFFTIFYFTCIIIDVIAFNETPILTVIFLLGTILPTLSVLIRRLHDIGKSGWWYFIQFIPFVGGIILLVFCCLESEDGENKYGENPLETSNIT